MLDAMDFLSAEYGADNVKFLGRGSDSAAYAVDGYVFRFTSKNRRIYTREADICRMVAPFVSVPVPSIDVVDNGDLFYARHKMLVGKKWSWHKFLFQPKKQRNLARSCAAFLAQLHSIDIDVARRTVPDMDAFGYMDFDAVRPVMEKYIPGFMLRFFEQNYVRVVGDKRTDTDLAVVHLGVKGANSVCNPDGSLCGVYDFGNCGIYERSRDFIPFLMGGNMFLYNQVRRGYERLAGVKIDAGRVRDLAELEFMSQKRWDTSSGVAVPFNTRYFQRRLAASLLHFAHLPRFILRPLLLRYMAWYSKRGK